MPDYPAPRPIQVPVSAADLGGPCVAGQAEIISMSSERGVATIMALDGAVEWLDEFDDVYFQTLRDGHTLKAIRLATEDDYRRFRAPLWIQDDETPTCCDRPMFFVGQIDDDHLYAEAPPDARRWWHDRASFYVFTCPVCLAVRVIGQQF
ncbi:MAG: hypothetical protein JW910_07230 [Anaerolineae bacterium]|nr:hypothetical protein [Anaerolineae bacterium]